MLLVEGITDGWLNYKQVFGWLTIFCACSGCTGDLIQYGPSNVYQGAMLHEVDLSTALQFKQAYWLAQTSKSSSQTGMVQFPEQQVQFPDWHGSVPRLAWSSSQTWHGSVPRLAWFSSQNSKSSSQTGMVQFPNCSGTGVDLDTWKRLIYSHSR